MEILYITVPCKAIFCGDIPLPRPYIGLIYGRYLQFRFLKWPLKKWTVFQIGEIMILMDDM